MADKFTCAACGESYDLVRDETWSEEQAIAEKDKNFPNIPLEDCDRVCDTCFKQMEAVGLWS